MIKQYSRRGFLAVAAASVALPALADAPLTSLRPVARPPEHFKKAVLSADALVDRAGLSGAVAFSVAHVDSGLVLEERNGQLGLPPASVAKALTAIYALNVLGPEFQFNTQVLATGGIVEGVVQGDLILAGGGDPTLDTDALGILADAVQQAGITGVTGKFLVYGSALPQALMIDADQPEHVGYNPAVSGLNLNFNRVHFEWRKAAADYTVTMQARSRHYRPDVKVAHMAVEARDMPVYTYSDANGRDEWTVAKGALGKEGARWLPVRKPVLYTGEVFRTLLASKQIQLSAPTPVDTLPTADVLVEHKSAPLAEILRAMLKYSTNITAEVVGLTASRQLLGKVATIHASASAMSDWAQENLGMTNVAMVDHSGLGAASRMSGADMVSALVAARKSVGLKDLLKDIPMRDRKRKILKESLTKVQAKTGTLNFVSSLAGFIDAPDGTEMAFAIFTADLPLRNGLKKEERERPPGARRWNGRSKVLQQDLIDRWSLLYGT